VCFEIKRPGEWFNPGPATNTTLLHSWLLPYSTPVVCQVHPRGRGLLKGPLCLVPLEEKKYIPILNVKKLSYLWTLLKMYIWNVHPGPIFTFLNTPHGYKDHEGRRTMDMPRYSWILEMFYISWVQSLGELKSYSGRLGGVMVRASDLWSIHREFDSRSVHDQVNSAFRPSGVGKSSTSLLAAGDKAGRHRCVHLCILCDPMWRVTPRSSVLGLGLINSYTLL